MCTARCCTAACLRTPATASRAQASSGSCTSRSPWLSLPSRRAAAPPPAFSVCSILCPSTSTTAAQSSWAVLTTLPTLRLPLLPTPTGSMAHKS
ncbi:hypothetical protein IW139_002315, partial [Coemansia sp. RSA 353]